MKINHLLVKNRNSMKLDIYLMWNDKNTNKLKIHKN